MKSDGLQYGYRNRNNGKLMRLEERYSDTPEYGVEIDRYLTCDEAFPFLQDDDLGSIFNFKYGPMMYSRALETFFVSRDIRMDDFDIVEFATTSRASPEGGDPLQYVVEVGVLEFDFVHGVRYQYPSREGAGAKSLKGIFLRSELAAMSDVPSPELVVLRSDVTDVSRAGLVGKIIVPDVARTSHAKPLGIVDVRSVDGITYAIATYDVRNPRFRRTVSLVDGLEIHDKPWNEIKVAFEFDDSADGSMELLNAIWDEGFNRQSIWPRGWNISESDASGTRMVVVFSVEGAISEADGRAVRRMLDSIAAGIDPRDVDAGPGKPSPR